MKFNEFQVADRNQIVRVKVEGPFVTVLLNRKKYQNSRERIQFRMFI